MHAFIQVRVRVCMSDKVAHEMAKARSANNTCSCTGERYQDMPRPDVLSCFEKLSGASKHDLMGTEKILLRE
jgi:hypothetical protein